MCVRASGARACGAGVGEQNVDDNALRGSDQDLLDELFALVVSAVRPYKLHLSAGEGDVEDPRVRRVREIEADDLALLRLELQGASPEMSMTLPKRPIATCVVSAGLKAATFPSSIRMSSSVRASSRCAGGQYSGSGGATRMFP